METRRRPAPNTRRFDVLAVGHAIVDVLSHAPDEFLVSQRLAKGHMQLVDRERSAALYSNLGPATEVSGGSAANTLVGVSGLGGSSAFIGTVADDQLGEFFAHDLRSAGVNYEVEPLTGDAATGRSLIIITPDGQRTMNTYLGAAANIKEEHFDESLFGQSSILFVEGYLFDIAWGERLYKHLLSRARDHGCLVALTLSDPFVIQRYRSAIENALDEGVDILFANDDELQALFPGIPFEQAVDTLAKMCPYVAITRGAVGSLVIEQGNVTAIPSYPAKVVDTTGAGDLYAAGFLYGFTHGETLEKCGHLGSAAASEVISHIGARPEVDLAQFVNGILAREQNKLPGM